MYAELISGLTGAVMTNSAQWPCQAPESLGARAAFGSLAECVRSGLAGRVVRDERRWAEATGQDGGFGLVSGGRCRAVGVMAVGALLDYYRVTVPAARAESVVARSGVEDSRERVSSESRLQCLGASTGMCNLVRRRKP